MLFVVSAYRSHIQSLVRSHKAFVFSFDTSVTVLGHLGSAKEPSYCFFKHYKVDVAIASSNFCIFTPPAVMSCISGYLILSTFTL